jgi:hypothetical protein
VNDEGEKEELANKSVDMQCVKRARTWFQWIAAFSALKHVIHCGFSLPSSFGRFETYRIRHYIKTQ